jgi:hypothetical protein
MLISFFLNFGAGFLHVFANAVDGITGRNTEAEKAEDQ